MSGPIVICNDLQYFRRAHHRRCDDALKAPVFVFDRNTLELRVRDLRGCVTIMLGLAYVPAATTSGPIEPTALIERVVEGRHDEALRDCAGDHCRRRSTDLQQPCQTLKMRGQMLLRI